MERRRLGIAGEDLAAAWYVEQGYEIVDRNWRNRSGEIDLVVRRGRTTVFCEVKSRSSLAFGSPLEAVDRRKQQRLRRLAAQWIEASPVRAGEVRFDVAAVMGGHVEVIEAAF